MHKPHTLLSFKRWHYRRHRSTYGYLSTHLNRKDYIRHSLIKSTRIFSFHQSLT